MGLLNEHGNAKFADYTPALGVCQWFHFEDPRLDDAVKWLRRLGVTLADGAELVRPLNGRIMRSGLIG